jgi:hypothetical protein
MITRLAVAVTVAWAVLAPMASAQITYVGSSTIGDHIIPAAAKAFTAKTGIPSEAWRRKVLAKVSRWS